MTEILARLRSAALAAGLLAAGYINLGPHLPFSRFQDNALAEPETPRTVSVTLAPKAGPYAIPLLERRGDSTVETGLHVEVRMQREAPAEAPGGDVTSKPTLCVIAATLGAYVLLLLPAWALRAGKRR